MFKIALLGAGGMASTHARGYANLPDARLVAVLDTRQEAADALAKLATAHRAKSYTDLDELMNEQGPDIVDVSVPTPFHVDYVCRAAQFGGHKPRAIIVEKPMGRTLAECDRMIEVCKSNGIALFVAHVLRFFPEYIAAKAEIDAGAVGKPCAIRMRRGGQFPRGWNNWYGNVGWSGGAILDLIIHDFDWLQWTFGPVERVFAKSLSSTWKEGEEIERDYALVTLRFNSGAMAHVEGTWADPGGFKVQLEVAGDGGLLEYNFNTPASAPFVSALSGEEGARASVAVPESPTATNPYQAELAHFLDCVANGMAPKVTAEEGREAVRIALAAIESSQTGKVISL